MHKFILIFLLLTTYIFSNINAIVSIAPEKTFLQAIGGDKVNITVMVQAGNSPHTYEPKPSQMLAVTKAQLYFAIDVEFEQVWLPKFTNLNPHLEIIDLAAHVNKIPMLQHDEHTQEHRAHSHEEHHGKDPHIWTSPENVKIIAQNIYETLIKYDSANTSYYKSNLDTFLALIKHTDTQIKEILSSLKDNRTFMVFHPSWGYFAHTYHLEQIAVEVEGKAPKPKELVALIKEAKKEKVKAIFTQPEFSDSSVKIIASQLHIPVVKVSPLAENWSDNLLFIAHTIAGKN